MLSGFELYPRWVPLYYPSSKDKKLIQYLESRMKNMKYRIQDYLGLPNYHVPFCFEFDFLSGKKGKKTEQAKQTFKKNLSRIFICVVLSIRALFSIWPTWPASVSIYWNKRKRLHIKENS